MAKKKTRKRPKGHCRRIQGKAIKIPVKQNLSIGTVVVDVRSGLHYIVAGSKTGKKYGFRVSTKCMAKAPHKTYAASMKRVAAAVGDLIGQVKAQAPYASHRGAGMATRKRRKK